MSDGASRDRKVVHLPLVRPRHAAPDPDAPPAPAEPPPYAGGAPSSLPGTAMVVAVVLGALYSVVGVLDVFTHVTLPGGLRGDPSTLIYGVLMLASAGLARARRREGFWLAAALNALSLVELLVAHWMSGAPATSLFGAIIRGAMVAMFWRSAGVMARPRERSRALLALALACAVLPSSYSYWALSRYAAADRVAVAGVGALNTGDEATARARLAEALRIWPAHEGARTELAAVVYKGCMAGPPGPSNAPCAEVVRLLQDGEDRAHGFLQGNPNAGLLMGKARERLGTAAAPAPGGAATGGAATGGALPGRPGGT
ncbi:MAG TPA: hypothetical protein VG389_13925 [Myxococcota bacterium]|jgi:hypothetical protein|nr:hypothetical protein [Myxococcota bacterium]